MSVCRKKEISWLLFYGTEQYIVDLKQRNEYDNDNDKDNQNMKEHSPGIQIQSRNLNPV